MNNRNVLDNHENRENILPNNERIISELQEKFWENIVEEITSQAKETGIDSFEKLNEKLGKTFMSSCFHPDEFPIGAYRTTSLINIAELAERLGIRVEVDHLDTITNGGIKNFPNVQFNKGKKISRYATEISEENRSTKDYLREIYRVYDAMLAPYKSKWKQDIKEEDIKFFQNIFVELGISEELNTFLEENFSDKKEKDRFKAFLFKDKMISNFDDIKDIFKRKIMSPKYKNGFSEVQFYAEFQNAILTKIFEKFLPEYQQKLQKAGIIDENGVNIQISYDNEPNRQKYSEAFEMLLNDEIFGADFLKKYSEKLLERSGGRPVTLFSLQNHTDFLVWRDKEGKLGFYKKSGKNVEEIPENDFFALITNKNEKINFSGATSLLLSILAGQFHIGSERELRPLIAEVTRDHLASKNLLNEKTEKYIANVVGGLGIFDVYEDGGDNTGKNLAGSEGVAPNDMLKLLFVDGEFARDQMKKATLRHDVKPEIDRELLFDNFRHIADTTHSNLKQANFPDKDKVLREFYDKASKFDNEKNIENFFQLMKFCFDVAKFAK